MVNQVVEGEVTRRVYMPRATVRRYFEEATIAEAVEQALDEALNRLDEMKESNHGD
jgi:AcrR family transcriptional regulator